MPTKVKSDQAGFTAETTGALKPQIAFSTHRTHFLQRTERSQGAFHHTKMPPINQAKPNSGIILNKCCLTNQKGQCQDDRRRTRVVVIDL